VENSRSNEIDCVLWFAFFYTAKFYCLFHSIGGLEVVLHIEFTYYTFKVIKSACQQMPETKAKTPKEHLICSFVNSKIMIDHQLEIQLKYQLSLLHFTQELN